MTPPELHRPLPAEKVGEHPYLIEVVADVAECAALAARMQIPAVRSLVCQFRLTTGQGGSIAAQGALRARVTQICVVSLEPFDSDVHEDFRVRFVPAGRENDDDDPEADDELPYEGASIDLGEAAAEQLALALDPYPRAPGAVLPGDVEAGSDSPFAALARLRRPQ
jgi:uncharacterized metal-binding protein YceD (DUF177 family)